MIPIARPTIGKMELKNIEKVFKTRWLGMGSFVYEFEKKIESYLGVKHVVAVNTGTTAIHVALSSIGVGPGDEVIVPSLTFAGSVQPIVSLGARPVFCEIEPDTLNIDVVDAEKRITKKTRAILTIHYGGMPCDMDMLLKIGKKKKIRIVEDAAHAFGSLYKGKKIGNFGDIACFSFDPIKNLTCGEGGCVTTNNAELAALLRKKRLLGITRDTWMRYKNKRSWFYEIVTEGYRYHMSNINASIGIAQFKKFEKFIEKKKRIVKEYDDFFKYVKGIELLRRNYTESAPFNYTIRVSGSNRENIRDRFIGYMAKRGISIGINYIPNHIQPFFRRFRKRLPVTEKVWKEIVSLPLYYDMTKAELKKVEYSVKRFMEGKRK
ncbi:MAG: DegT/DnrJ/EryC1/StrS family aminotransferase [Candidatus Omnitrophota bacterium]|nr:MAG: DegT/DnrJ/EryC1/StrS family aminotransferase [Candidatus Omnitrophota bacterium]